MDNVKYKILAYNIVRMEENEEDIETFWYHCARLVKSITMFFSHEDNEKMNISEICLFLHKQAMVGGGKYSENGRIVGRHVCVDPLYIEEYMKTLDSFYVIHKTNKNIAILVYFNFISIHPFSDGNGRVAKLLFYILKKNR